MTSLADATARLSALVDDARIRGARAPAARSWRPHRPAFPARLAGPRAAPRRQVLEAADRERRPPLKARAEAAAGVTAEVLVEADEVPPVRIVAEAPVVPVAGTAPAGVADEQRREATCQLARDLGERHGHARSGRTLDAEIRAVEVVVALERLDQQVVDREPDGSAPIRVPAEEKRVGFRGRVVDPVLVVADADDVRSIAVHARQRTDAVRRQEFALVEHVPERPLEPLARRQREEPAAAIALRPRERAGQVGSIVEEPAHPLREPGQLLEGRL